MKIHGINPLQAIKSYTNRNQVQEAGKKPESQMKDAVDISPQARELQALREKMAEIPEIREEKVAEIQKQLSSGQYQVDLDRLVDNLLQEIHPEAEVKDSDS